LVELDVLGPQRSGHEIELVGQWAQEDRPERLLLAPRCDLEARGFRIDSHDGRALGRDVPQAALEGPGEDLDLDFAPGPGDAFVEVEPGELTQA
jgi:hypothetical protein